MRKGQIMTKEQRLKLSNAKLWVKIWKYKPRTQEHIKNLSNSLKWRKSPTEWKKMSEETKLKIKLKAFWRPSHNKGKKMSEEQKEKIRLKCLWKPWTRNGIKLSEDIKLKLRIANLWKTYSESINNKKWLKGELNPCWKWGLSFEEYWINWTDELRDSIRSRDNYVCIMCWLHQDELQGMHKKHDVHHIDYNKHNLNPINLITLCKQCHSKTNYNREYRIEYFNDLISYRC